MSHTGPLVAATELKGFARRDDYTQHLILPSVRILFLYAPPCTSISLMKVVRAATFRRPIKTFVDDGRVRQEAIPLCTVSLLRTSPYF